MSAPPVGAAAARLRQGLIAVVIGIASLQLFAQLGHYALSEDEANSALSARSVLQSGDTSAWVDGHNLIAFRQGAEIRDLKLRYLPPLPAYLAAPSLAVFGETAGAARLPFALCGLASVAVLLLWLSRSGAGNAMWLLTSLAMLGNTSFFLFMKQCRYYAPATLLTLIIGYAYVRRGRYWAPLVGVVSFALLATNTINYAAACAVLALDYWVWARHEHRVSRREWLQILLPQVAAGGALLAIWNPLLHHVAPESSDWLRERATLLWWNLRDLDRCEFGALLLLLAVALVRRPFWLRRAGAALAVYLVAVTLVSPQPVSLTSEADIRYLVPILPLCMVIQAGVLSAVTQRTAVIALFGLIAFGTNWLNSSVIGAGPHSTPWRYLGELRDPPADPYRVASDWINAHVRAGQTVRVLPQYMTYPLMFHAPAPTYAAQLAWPPAPQFRGLPDVHFLGRVRPDFVIAFGSTESEIGTENLGPVADVATLDIYWHETYRPELIWRRFGPKTDYDHQTEVIKIYRLAPAAGR